MTLSAVSGAQCPAYRDGANRTYVSTKPFKLLVAEPHIDAKFAHSSIERGRTANITVKLNNLKPFEGKAKATLGRLPRGVELVEPIREISAEEKEVTFSLKAANECLTGGYQGIKLDLIVTEEGHAVRQLSGFGTLRIDAERGVKAASKSSWEHIMSVRPIPDGYHSITPNLIVKGAAEAIDFYKQVFGATELMRCPMPGGAIGHAEIKIGDSPLMLADEFPDMNIRGPKSIGGTPLSLVLYVENVDEVFARAIAAGAKELRPLQNQFYGDRSGTLEDPFGHWWTIATHIEDLSPEEIERRMSEMKS